MKLIDCLSALIDEEYAGSATVVEIKSICEAAIEICPSMKGPSGGIVSSKISKKKFPYSYVSIIYRSCFMERIVVIYTINYETKVAS